MIKYIIPTFCFFCVSTGVFAQSFWKRMDESHISGRSEKIREIIPVKYETFSLNVEDLKAYLTNAPLEFSGNRSDIQALSLDIPMPDGAIEKFSIYESPVMESELAARYPNIKSYKGYSTKNKANVIRFAVSPTGFHAAIQSPIGEVYIDPYSIGNTENYIVYYTKDDLSEQDKNIKLCGVDDVYRPEQNFFKPNSRFAPQVELRIYRMAMACTGEWGTRRGTVEKCLADMNAMLTRMNLIYEKDMAIRYVLINDNDKLIFLNGSTDPYDTPQEGRKLIGINTSKINAIISSGSYDIGHVLTINCTDGISGIAQFGALCQSNKGNGVTCHGSESISVLVTRVLAHEIGHQLNASHTWNICTSSADQRSANTAFEPGSGTTIMSYAGSCGTDNVASDNDDYFHIASLDQMYAKTLNPGNAYACAQKVVTNNRFPVINTMPKNNVFIPASTPFELGVKATDEDGDVLTYCWEQYDSGEISSLGTGTTTGALFRSFRPSQTGSVRFFPRSSSITSGIFNDKTEVLPNSSRTMNFRVSVRDNNVAAGGVVWDGVTVNVTGQAGPFKITYPEFDARFKVGQVVDVTWDVAGTDLAPVNCKTVNIYGSINNELVTGSINMIPLALNVPNDGSQEIIIPNKITSFFRVVIKAADNIFLTSGVLPSRIEAPTVPGIFFETTQNDFTICQPNTSKIDFTTAGLFGFNGDITFELASALPAGVTASFSSNTVKAGSPISLNISTSGVSANISTQISVRAYATGTDTLVRMLNINIIANDLADIKTNTPTNGASSVPSLPEFSWQKKNDAQVYEVQVATNPNFSTTNVVFTQETSGLMMTSGAILDKAKIHYWRVRGINACGPGPWSEVQAFITEALICKTYKSGEQSINISASGSPSVEIPVLVEDSGTANDINIKLIRAEHNRLVDLEGFLISPSGKTLTLWSRKCGTQKNLLLGLDDQSPDFFQCPINTGKIYRPENPLSTLNGEQTKGLWKLQIDDKQSGEGGRLLEFDIELCANVTVSNPFLVNNKILKLHPGNKKIIADTTLLSSDDNNTAAELKYTIIKLPSEGLLLLNGISLMIGSQFTQVDINAGALIFDDTSNKTGTDSFAFTVTDGQGGWISITTFSISRDSGIINSAEDEQILNSVQIFPNPATDQITILVMDQGILIESYSVINGSGKILLSGNLTSSNTQIPLDMLPSGLYIIRLKGDKNIVAKKFIKL